MTQSSSNKILREGQKVICTKNLYNQNYDYKIRFIKDKMYTIEGVTNSSISIENEQGNSHSIGLKSQWFQCFRIITLKDTLKRL